MPIWSGDSTIAIARDPYRFISRRGRQLGVDAFETRVALATLFGRDGVQTLDDEAHRHRKALFGDVLGADAVRRLPALADEEWRRATRSSAGGRVALYELAKQVHCRAVCAWAGLTGKSASSHHSSGIVA